MKNKIAPKLIFALCSVLVCTDFCGSVNNKWFTVGEIERIPWSYLSHVAWTLRETQKSPFPRRRRCCRCFEEWEKGRKPVNGLCSSTCLSFYNHAISSCKIYRPNLPSPEKFFRSSSKFPNLLLRDRAASSLLTAKTFQFQSIGDSRTYFGTANIFCRYVLLLLALWNFFCIPLIEFKLK